MGLIYLITNLINNKVYVGKTEQTLHRRWIDHKSHARRQHNPGIYLHNAIRKYGEENFDIQGVAETEDPDKLNNLEKLWIVILRTNDDRFGYNLTAGGEGAVGRIMPEDERLRRIGLQKGPKSSQYRHDVSNDQILTLYESGLGSYKIADKLGITPPTVRRRLKEEIGTVIREKNSYPQEWGSSVKPASDQEIVKLYNAGLSPKQVGLVVGLSANGVRGRLIKLNAPLRSNVGRKHSYESLKKRSESRKGAKNYCYRHDITIEDVISLRSQGLTRKQIAKKLNCSHSVVDDRIKQHKMDKLLSAAVFNTVTDPL